jgi:hypothetical protein
MRKLSQTWHRLVVSGGAERRRRTTRRCIRKVMKYVGVRRISRNVGRISIEIFVIIPRGTKRTSVLLVLLGTSWYFLVLLGTSSYFLYFFVLRTSWYFLVLLRTSSYFLVLLCTSWYFPILLGTSVPKTEQKSSVIAKCQKLYS